MDINFSFDILLEVEENDDDNLNKLNDAMERVQSNQDLLYKSTEPVNQNSPQKLIETTVTSELMINQNSSGKEKKSTETISNQNTPSINLDSLYKLKNLDPRKQQRKYLSEDFFKIIKDEKEVTKTFYFHHNEYIKQKEETITQLLKINSLLKDKQQVCEKMIAKLRGE